MIGRTKTCPLDKRAGHRKATCKGATGSETACHSRTWVSDCGRISDAIRIRTASTTWDSEPVTAMQDGPGDSSPAHHGRSPRLLFPM